MHNHYHMPLLTFPHYYKNKMPQILKFETPYFYNHTKNCDVSVMQMKILSQDNNIFTQSFSHTKICFPHYCKKNYIPFLLRNYLQVIWYSKGKLWPWLYPIQCERNWRYGFISVENSVCSCCHDTTITMPRKPVK